MGFSKLQDILNACEKKSVPFWKAVLLKDVKERYVSEEASFWTAFVRLFLIFVTSPEILLSFFNV